MQMHADELTIVEALGRLSKRERDQLALRLGVDSVTVWRWSKGRSHPASHGTREALVDDLRQQHGLHVTADQLPELPEAA